KEEMACLDSLIVRAAYQARVPAGSALAVDREKFSHFVDQTLNSLSTLTRLTEEVVAIEPSHQHLQILCEGGRSYQAQHVVMATGPLTSDPLSQWIAQNTKKEHLYFYDAIAPIVEKDSINMNVAFKASRWD